MFGFKTKPPISKNLTLPDGRVLEIDIKRHHAARRMKLRLGTCGTKVIVSMPPKMNERLAISFAKENIDWIKAQIFKQTLSQPFEIGSDIPVFGKKTILENIPPRTKGGLVKEGAGLPQILKVPSNPINFSTKTKVMLKKIAQDAMETHLKIIGPKIEKYPNEMKICDTKSRWGSCTSGGKISLCWRLVFAPPAVFQYVLAHEMAHLKEMNHSPKFWAEVARLMPDYKTHQKWLKQNGAMLHRIGL